MVVNAIAAHHDEELGGLQLPWVVMQAVMAHFQAANVGSSGYLNFRLDVSSIDLDRWGGPFVAAGGQAPVFRISLFDNPGGAAGIGSGTALSWADAASTPSAGVSTATIPLPPYST